MQTRIVSFKPGTAYLGKSGQALNDSERFSVGYFETLIDGYESIVDSYHKDSWELASDFCDPRSSRGPTAWRDNLAGIRLGYDGGMELMEIHPARVRSIMQSSESQAINNSPKIIVSALTPKMQRLAPIFETAANAEWQRDKAMKRMLRLCFRDAWRTGFGFALNGWWSTSYKKDELKRRGRSALAKRLLGNPLANQISEVYAQQQREFTDSINLEPQELTFEGDARIYKNGICSKRVSPFSIVFDVDAASIEEAQWIGRTIIADYNSIQEDDNLSNKKDVPTQAIKDIDRFRQGMVKLGMPTRFGMMDAKGPYRYAVLYEIFYRNDHGGWDMMVMARGMAEPLRIEEDVFAMGNPYSILQWNEQGDSLFATSDFDDIKTLLLAERNALKRLHDGVMRSLLDTTIFDKSYFPKAQDTEFLMVPGVGMVGYAESAHTQRPLKDGTVTLQQSRVTGEVTAYLHELERYFQIASGLGQNQIGQAMKSETSATEAAAVQAWVKARGGVKFAAMEDFVSDIAQKRIQLMAQFRDYDTIGTLAGPDAAAAWAQEDFTDGDIQGGLLVKVEQGSMQPQDDSTRAEVAKEFIGLSQVPAFAGVINQLAALRMYANARGVMDGSDLLVNVSQKDIEMAIVKMQMMSQMGGQGGGGLTPPAAPPQNGAPLPPGIPSTEPAMAGVA